MAFNIKLKLRIGISLFVLSTQCGAYPASWQYHRLRVPTTAHHQNEVYDVKWKYFTWGYDDSEFNIQMHRFEPNAPFPKLITTKPPLAFKVPNLKKAIKGREVLWGTH